MIASNFYKILCPALLAATLFSSCNFWQTSETESDNSSQISANELKSGIPFATKDPKIFQADFVITNYSGGEKSERKIAVARNAEKHRYDYPSKVSFLQLGENERFLIDNERKVYAKSQTDFEGKDEQDESLKDFLTTKWLNEKHDAKFENLGTENGLTKYLITAGGAKDQDSETIIYFNEDLKIPVKQEFSLVNGEKKTKVYSVEIRDLKLKADENRFKLPAGFKQISVEEFQEGVWKKRFGKK